MTTLAVLEQAVQRSGSDDTHWVCATCYPEPDFGPLAVCGAYVGDHDWIYDDSMPDCRNCVAQGSCPQCGEPMEETEDEDTHRL